MRIHTEVSSQMGGITKGKENTQPEEHRILRKQASYEQKECDWNYWLSDEETSIPPLATNCYHRGCGFMLHWQSIWFKSFGLTLLPPSPLEPELMQLC